MNKRLLILLTLIYGNYVQGTEDDKALDDSNIIVFLNVNVVPMDKERVIPEQTVVVENGMITGIASVSDVTISKAATRIDGTGKYLIPGIAEMHGHLPGPGYSREATENTLFLYVANGVTLLRGMQGHPQQLELKRKIQRGELIGPRLLVSSPPLSGRNTKSPEMAESKVREAKSKGYDHLKIHEGLSLDVYDTIARTAQQLGIPFAGHVSNYVGLRHALNSGQHTVDHLDNYVEALIENSESTVSQATITSAELVADVSESLIPVIVNETVKAGTAVVPTMALWEHFLGNVSGLALQQSTVGLAYMPQSTVSDWSRRIGNSGYSPANKKNYGA